jgi:phage/plasmid primase-like uncharacterized protein
MPKGPKGEKRAADGDRQRCPRDGDRDRAEYEDDPGKAKAAAKLGRKGGMDFQEATDKLCAKLEHADLARALGASVQAVRQARLSNGCAQLPDRRQQTGRMP